MANRPTTSQLEALVEFLEQNPGIVKGLLRTAQGKVETKRKWSQLATSLNALGGVIKDGPGWAKYWSEKKCTLKKLCAEESLSMRQTGGGVSQHRTILSDLDRRFVAVMGGPTFASGDSELAVNPFPQMHSAADALLLPSTSAPSTSTIRMEVIEDDVVLPTPPPLPSPPVSQDIPLVPPSEPTPRCLSSAENPANRRPRRSFSRSVDADIDRMARMEERRIEAERLTAEALAYASRRLDRIGNGTELIAQAITEVANALLQIAHNLRN